MNIFVYSDESGVFDKIHNQIFTFGGVIFLSKQDRDNQSRKYLHAENCIRKSSLYTINQELKACKINNQEKYKLYRSLGQCIKFGAVVDQRRVLDRIFYSKKDKQRYLDYVYKISLKRAFQALNDEGRIDLEQVKNLYIFADEHTTATNGCYDLREGLEAEFKLGTYNYNYGRYFPPVFYNLDSVNLKFCNSCTQTLIRAADIVANKIYHDSISNQLLLGKTNLYVTYFP